MTYVRIKLPVQDTRNAEVYCPGRSEWCRSDERFIFTSPRCSSAARTLQLFCKYIYRPRTKWGYLPWTGGGGTVPNLDGGTYLGQGVTTLDGGTFPIRLVRGTPPPSRRQSSTASTGYAVGGMPLAMLLGKWDNVFVILCIRCYIKLENTRY